MPWSEKPEPVIAVGNAEVFFAPQTLLIKTALGSCVVLRKMRDESLAGNMALGGSKVVVTSDCTGLLCEPVGMF